MLKKRIVTSLWGLSLLYFLMTLHHASGKWFLGIACALTTWESLELCSSLNKKWHMGFAGLLGLWLSLSSLMPLNLGSGLALGSIIMVTLGSLVWAHKNQIEEALALGTRVWWVLSYQALGWLSLSSLYHLETRGWLWWLLAIVMGADTGGYVAGLFWGKHSLAPRISPKKTWEGVGGSLVLGTALGLFVSVFYNFFSWHMFWAIPGLVFWGIWGDLLESVVKRSAGVKDSGSLLPGHGGLWDRLDGVLAAAPLALGLHYFLQFL